MANTILSIIVVVICILIEMAIIFFSERKGKVMKYTIDYGFGYAVLYTPYDPTKRFYQLANTCFGIRKSIMQCVIIKKEDVSCDDFERLEFNGDVYIWREDGARKMLEPKWAADEDWDVELCEECVYKEEV